MFVTLVKEPNDHRFEFCAKYYLRFSCLTYCQHWISTWKTGPKIRFHSKFSEIAVSRAQPKVVTLPFSRIARLGSTVLILFGTWSARLRRRRGGPNLVEKFSCDSKIEKVQCLNHLRKDQKNHMFEKGHEGGERIWCSKKASSKRKGIRFVRWNYDNL